MPVTGREIASLDFTNLIGGPLDAIVRAQAKSAITTANFIREVGFEADGKLKTVDFKYNKRNEEGKKQEFTLTVPFLTMLPIPYITIYEAVVDFNAKITSTTQSDMSETTSYSGEFSGGAKFWFVSASVNGKTSTQKKTATSEKEERSFDMHVRVEAKNQDVPAGTDRLLTILEEAMGESKGPKVVTALILEVDNGQHTLTLQSSPPEALNQLTGTPSFEINQKRFKITSLPTKENRWKATVSADQPLADDMKNQSIQFELAEN